MTDQPWRKCSSCKDPIPFGATYWACNVSTCNSKRMGLFFCSVSCWEAHLPTMRHRESWAVEKRAPSRAAWEQEQASEAESGASSSAAPELSSMASSSGGGSADAPRRRTVASPPARDDDSPQDILIVVSKLKKYIKARSGFNTSDAVMSVLSDHVRALCDQAIRTAAQNERKTVMDRDFPPVSRSRD